mgnify:CR=1 FL=1
MTPVVDWSCMAGCICYLCFVHQKEREFRAFFDKGWGFSDISAIVFYTKRQNMVRGKLGEDISKSIEETQLALLRLVYNTIGKKVFSFQYMQT